MPAAYTISIMGNALGLLEKNTELIDIFKDIIIRIKKIVFEELGGFNLVFYRVFSFDEKNFSNTE